MQQQKESVQEYMTALQKLSLYCKFEEYNCENRIAKSVCVWFAESANPKSITKNGRINNGICFENSQRDELVERDVQELKTNESAAMDFVSHDACTSKKTSSMEVKSKAFANRRKNLIRRIKL